MQGAADGQTLNAHAWQWKWRSMGPPNLFQHLGRHTTQVNASAQDHPGGKIWAGGSDGVIDQSPRSSSALCKRKGRQDLHHNTPLCLLARERKPGLSCSADVLPAFVQASAAVDHATRIWARKLFKEEWVTMVEGERRNRSQAQHSLRPSLGSRPSTGHAIGHAATCLNKTRQFLAKDIHDDPARTARWAPSI